MKKVPPLLVTVVLLGSEAPRAGASSLPPGLAALAGRSEYVLLVDAVDRRDIQEIRVIEYEVTRVLKGAPPDRFVMITHVWERGEEEEEGASGEADAPTPTDSEVMFLMTNDPQVSAPWSMWEELIRSTRGLPVLGAPYSKTVVIWRGVLGVMDEKTGLVPLDTYLDSLAAAVEQAAHEPAASSDAQSPPQSR